MVLFIGILVGLALMFFVSYMQGEGIAKKQAELNEKLLSIGVDIQSTQFKANYLSGHPDIDNSHSGVSALFENGKLALWLIPDFTKFESFNPTQLGYISTDSINNIVVEDKTTIEKRVTVGRLLLTGVFALAWKKKRVDEAAYVVIEWNDGRFDHETVFEFTGKGSMQEANAARNKIIKAGK
jgi:hypothetical protein